MNHIFLFSLMIGLFNMYFTAIAQIDNDKAVEETKEVLPVFPGCENQEDSIRKVRCTETALLEYWYNHVKYPDSITGVALEGIVVVQFVVTKDGKIDKARISRGLGKPYDDEALRVINSMNKMEKRWIPGMKNGQPVEMSFYLPVRFQAPRDSSSSKSEEQVVTSSATKKKRRRKWKKNRKSKD